MVLIFNKRELEYIFMLLYDQYDLKKSPTDCPKVHPLIPGHLAFRISVLKTVGMNSLKIQPVKLVKFYAIVEVLIYVAPNTTSA